LTFGYARIYILDMAKKPIRRYAQLSVYWSVKDEIDARVKKAEKEGGDTNISRLLRRALMALDAQTK